MTKWMADMTLCSSTKHQTLIEEAENERMCVLSLALAVMVMLISSPVPNGARHLICCAGSHVSRCTLCDMQKQCLHEESMGRQPSRKPSHILHRCTAGTC